VALTRSDLKHMVEPEFKIGQEDWPAGWLVMVEQIEGGVDRFPIAETGCKEAKAAVRQVAEHFRQYAMERWNFEQGVVVDVSAMKAGRITVTTKLPDETVGLVAVEQTTVWYEAI
jgi:hypothetical protein